jgi:hypothetical protein
LDQPYRDSIVISGASIVVVAFQILPCSVFLIL